MLTYSAEQIHRDLRARPHCNAVLAVNAGRPPRSEQAYRMPLQRAPWPDRKSSFVHGHDPHLRLLADDSDIAGKAKTSRSTNVASTLSISEHLACELTHHRHRFEGRSSRSNCRGRVPAHWCGFARREPSRLWSHTGRRRKCLIACQHGTRSMREGRLTWATLPAGKMFRHDRHRSEVRPVTERNEEQ